MLRKKYAETTIASFARAKDLYYAVLGYFVDVKAIILKHIEMAPKNLYCAIFALGLFCLLITEKSTCKCKCFFQLYSFLRNELYSTFGRVILLRSDIRLRRMKERILYHIATKEQYIMPCAGTVYHIAARQYMLIDSEHEKTIASLQDLQQ